MWLWPNRSGEEAQGAYPRRILEDTFLCPLALSFIASGSASMMTCRVPLSLSPLDVSLVDGVILSLTSPTGLLIVGVAVVAFPAYTCVNGLANT